MERRGRGGGESVKVEVDDARRRRRVVFALRRHGEHVRHHAIGGLDGGDRALARNFATDRSQRHAGGHRERFSRGEEQGGFTRRRALWLEIDEGVDFRKGETGGGDADLCRGEGREEAVGRCRRDARAQERGRERRDRRRRARSGGYKVSAVTRATRM